MPNHNKLTDAETERLAILAEEMGEVIQIIGKVLRHGYDSRNPFTEDAPTNRQELEKELGDVELLIYLMAEAKDIDRNVIDKRRIAKGKAIKQWLHHQDD